jgi:hypothetical protein
MIAPEVHRAGLPDPAGRWATAISTPRATARQSKPTVSSENQGAPASRCLSCRIALTRSPPGALPAQRDVPPSTRFQTGTRRFSRLPRAERNTIGGAKRLLDSEKGLARLWILGGDRRDNHALGLERRRPLGERLREHACRAEKGAPRRPHLVMRLGHLARDCRLQAPQPARCVLADGWHHATGSRSASRPLRKKRGASGTR